MNAKDILELVNKELEFYRKRLLSVYYFSLLSQVLVITGQRTIKVTNQLIADVTYSVFFVTIAVLCVLFSSSYSERIYKTREARANLIKEAGFGEPLPKHGNFEKPSPRWHYIITIVSLSVLGTILVWIGK